LTLATVAIFPPAETGHFNATLGLARQLTDAGHRVIYVGPDDGREAAELEGFPYLGVWQDVLPPGWFAEHQRRLARCHPLLAPLILDDWGERVRVCMRSEDVLSSVLEAVQPDLILIDEHHPVGFLFLDVGVPVAALLTSLPQYRQADRPPLSTALVTPRNPGERLRVRVSWWRTLLLQQRYKAFALLRPFFTGAFSAIMSRAEVTALRAWYRAMYQGAGAGNLTCLVLAPREFDLPGAPLPPGFVYVGGAVADRHQPHFQWSPIDADPRPLVLVSFGSQVHRLAKFRHVAHAVVQVARIRPRWRFLLVDGRSALPIPQDIPDNLQVVPFVPQLQALRRTAVMLTHGGLNTIKECLALGVPMLVVPMGFDQPGNAARVSWHGLGLHLAASRLTTGRLAAALTELLQNPTYRSRVRAMAQQTAHYDIEKAALRAVERLLNRNNKRGDHSPGREGIA
jgi:MGT family glycosyltransferase